MLGPESVSVFESDEVEVGSNLEDGVGIGSV